MNPSLMPGPVSRTMNITWVVDPSRETSLQASVIVPPSGVNLMAFETRFTRHCLILVASPT